MVWSTDKKIFVVAAPKKNTRNDRMYAAEAINKNDIAAIAFAHE